MKKNLFALSIFLISVLGCHAQLPTNPHTVILTWTAPATGCTPTTCTYVISRATVASGATSCPAPSSTGPVYTPLNQSSPATGTTYTDTVPSAQACYVAQTILNGDLTHPSVASNTAGPLVVPASPLAPAINGTVADKQELPLKLADPDDKGTVAWLTKPGVLTARLGK